MKIKAFTLAALSTVLGSSLLLTSCESSSAAEVVNLDTILDKFISAAESLPEVADGDMESDSNIPVFEKEYTTQLNAVPLMAKPVGVYHVEDDGSFRGYSDANANGTKDSSEKDLFTVEVDTEKSRLIATDLGHGYHRDTRFSGGGFLAGYLVSRMMFGQNRAGITSSKFNNMRMSPKGYHSNAVKSVKSAASARSTSGSKSFRVGK